MGGVAVRGSVRPRRSARRASASDDARRTGRRPRSSRRLAYALRPGDRRGLAGLPAPPRGVGSRSWTTDFAATIDLSLALSAGRPEGGMVLAAWSSTSSRRLPAGALTLILDQHCIDWSRKRRRSSARSTRAGSGYRRVRHRIAWCPAWRRAPTGTRQRLAAIRGLLLDVPETDQLFREAYQHPLEPDVIEELIAGPMAGCAPHPRPDRLEDGTHRRPVPLSRSSAPRAATSTSSSQKKGAGLAVAGAPALLTRVSVPVSVDAETRLLVDTHAPDEVAPPSRSPNPRAAQPVPTAAPRTASTPSSATSS